MAGKDAAIARRLVAGTTITLIETCGESFVYLRQGHSARVVQDKLFRRHGFNPHMLLETDSLEVGKRVALDAGACMLMSNIYVDDYVRQKLGEFFPLADYDNHRHFYACYRKDEFVPRYTRDFIQITTRTLASARE